MFRILVVVSFCLSLSTPLSAQTSVPDWKPLFNGTDLSGWVNINTAPDTWTWKDDMLINTGKPIGVMCSEKMYENIILHVEWMHLEPGAGKNPCHRGQSPVQELQRRATY